MADNELVSESALFIRFVADAMLGTLAKWLRILGYDTVFDSALDDHQLARLARAEGRVLLTRDRELAGRRGLRALLIADQELGAQLGQVLAEFDLAADHAFSRCPVCNAELAALDPAEARRRVPEYVAETQERFSLCPRCQRVYWRGTHWQQMEEQLARIQAGPLPGPAGDSAVPGRGSHKNGG